MRVMNVIAEIILTALIVAACLPLSAWARDIEYNNSEVSIYVTPGEPTQIQFPGKISGGFKKKLSAVSIERNSDSLMIFAADTIAPQGEAILVRLDDGRSYSLRISRANPTDPRDAMVMIRDQRGSLIAGSSEEEPAYREKTFQYAPPSQVSGLVREMMLVAEFGKKAISGYRVSEQHSGQVVMDDGTMRATVDKIFIGPNLWGYVLDAQNLIDQTQKLNPASFRLDGTRAVSASDWEIAPRPLNVEQQISGKDKVKVYIVTRARKAG